MMAALVVPGVLVVRVVARVVMVVTPGLCSALALLVARAARLVVARVVRVVLVVPRACMAMVVRVVWVRPALLVVRVVMVVWVVCLSVGAATAVGVAGPPTRRVMAGPVVTAEIRV